MTNAKKVFHYFEEISRIPRESGDEKAIADYLVRFAQERNLVYFRDEHHNVIIKKPATVPDCTCAPVIIQGHTDMVYVRDTDCRRAYADGIGLIYQDGWLRADGTTLGADDGIAVAFALAALDSDDIKHPDLEAVFTVAEEIGLIGAGYLDYTKLQGKYMLNIDTEDEGVFYTSCAGAFRNELRIPVQRERIEELSALTVKICGLKGGHSGMEINEGRGNAITLMARLLNALGSDVRLCSLSAEGKTNAIANNAAAELLAEKTKLSELEGRIHELAHDFSIELGERDCLTVDVYKGSPQSRFCYTENSQKRVTDALSLLPTGVIGMSFNVPGLVETSANPAIVEQEENELIVLSSCRSSVGSHKIEMRAKYAALARLSGGESICSADYPQWEFRVDSPLRTLAMQTYLDMFGKVAETRAIHAGLECGYFDERLHSVDIISFGPVMQDVHTPRERTNIASVERTWALTAAILERLAENV